MEWASQKNNEDKNSNIPSSVYHQQRISPAVKIPASAWKTLAILSCVATMVMYADTLLIPAIPDVIKYFDVSYSMSSSILTAYLISVAVMTPIPRQLPDQCESKKILLI